MRIVHFKNVVTIFVLTVVIFGAWCTEESERLYFRAGVLKVFSWRVI